jgi:hypothetical protein
MLPLKAICSLDEVPKSFSPVVRRVRYEEEHLGIFSDSEGRPSGRSVTR